MILAWICFYGCSSSESKSEKENSLILTVTPQEILADGADKAIFSVRYNDQDVTASCRFKVNGNSRSTAQFTTSKEGEFRVVATYETLESNEVTINAVKNSASILTLSSDKTYIVLDDVDLATLLCKHKSTGKDYSDNVTFYVDGTVIQGNTFKPTKTGTFHITAKLGEDALVGEVVIEVGEIAKFIDRVLVEDYTGTWCPNCPRVFVTIEEALAKSSQVIPIAIHYNDIMMNESDVVSLCKTFNVEGFPHVVIDRITSTGHTAPSVSDFLSVLAPEGEVGIAIECKLEGKEIVASAKIKSKSNIEGAKCVAILTENKIYADQSNRGATMVNYEHNHVYRSSATALLGDPIALTANNLTTKDFRFPIKVYNVDNLEVIVMITNANSEVINLQKVKFGRKVGY